MAYSKTNALWRNSILLGLSLFVASSCRLGYDERLRTDVGTIDSDVADAVPTDADADTDVDADGDSDADGDLDADADADIDDADVEDADSEDADTTDSDLDVDVPPDADDDDEAADSDIEDADLCDEPCVLDNATSDCVGGACVIVDCDDGWGDCNSIAVDGCERPLDTLADCGACGVACSLDNADSSCATGTCEISSCHGGWDDCNSSAVDGCESSLDTTTNCGACGVACSHDNADSSCATGTCVLTGCHGGWDNCDGLAANGCESDFGCTSDCSGSCSGTCSLDCAAVSPCTCGTGCFCDMACYGMDASCEADCIGPVATCDAATNYDDSYALNCSSGALCSLYANETLDVVVTCSTSVCDVTCQSVVSCVVSCLDAAECSLDCTDTTDCTMLDCDGSAVTCADGTILCNRACP